MSRYAVCSTKDNQYTVLAEATTYEEAVTIALSMLKREMLGICIADFGVGGRNRKPGTFGLNYMRTQLVDLLKQRSL